MAIQTYYQIVTNIENAANSHDYVASFAHGPIDYLDSNSQNIKYPFVFLRPLTSIGYDQDTRLKTTTFELYALDVPKLSNESPVQIMSNMEQIILDISNIGCSVSFTELDISVLPSPWELAGAEVNQNFTQFEGDKRMNPYPKDLPEFLSVKLAKRYQDIFNLFVKHKDKISRVTFWGVSDKHSWLNDWPIKGRTNYPLLFDKNYQTKQAYKSLIEIKTKLQ